VGATITDKTRPLGEFKVTSTEALESGRDGFFVLKINYLGMYTKEKITRRKLALAVWGQLLCFLTYTLILSIILINNGKDIESQIIFYGLCSTCFVFNVGRGLFMLWRPNIVVVERNFKIRRASFPYEWKIPYYRKISFVVGIILASTCIVLDWPQQLPSIAFAAISFHFSLFFYMCEFQTADVG